MTLGQLGYMITPYGHIPGAYPSEIVRTSHGGQPLCPFDPTYNTRGEAGFYYDTQLGGARAAPQAAPQLFGAQLLGRSIGTIGTSAIPNDFQIARVRGLLTPSNGWIATNQGSYTESWVPPNGWTPTGATGVRINYGTPPQLGDAASDAANAATNAIVAELNAHHRRVFALTALSTAVVVFGGVLGAIRTMRLLRSEARRG